MAGSEAFYQPTYESGLFDFSGDLYKQQALDNQGGAIAARRAAANQRGLGKTPELGKGWSAHSLPIQQAYGIKLKKKIAADGVGDIAKSNELERELLMLKQFAQTDAEYGRRVDDMISKASGKDANKYTSDSLEEVLGFYDLQRNAMAVDEEGNLLFNGSLISPTNSPFTRIPNLRSKEDSIYNLMIESTPTGRFIHEGAEEVGEGTGDYYDVKYTKKDAAIGHYRNFLEDFVQDGKMTPEEADAMAVKGYEAVDMGYSKTPHIRKDGKGFTLNIGGKDVDTGKYKVSVSDAEVTGTADESGKPVTAKQMTISHPSGTKPLVEMSFVDEGTKKNQTNQIRLSTITKTPDGYLANADGYELVRMENEDYDHKRDKESEKYYYVPKSRGDVSFYITDKNRDMIQDTYLGGESIDSFFNTQGEASKSIDLSGYE